MVKSHLTPQSYTAVPIRAIQDRQLKRADWAVLTAYCYHADVTGYAFPSQSRIAELTGLSRQTVNLHTRRLCPSPLKLGHSLVWS